MATIRQKQTAVNKILKLSKKWCNREIFSHPMTDDSDNQYYFNCYMGVKTSEKIIDKQDLTPLDFDTSNYIDNILNNYCVNVDLSKYKEVKCDLKSLKAEKKWSKENKNKWGSNYYYDFNTYDSEHCTIVNIDFLITLLTIIDEGKIYIPSTITKPIIIQNDNSIGILCQVRPSDKTAEIFAKRDKEFRYVE